MARLAFFLPKWRAPSCSRLNILRGGLPVVRLHGDPEGFNFLLWLLQFG